MKESYRTALNAQLDSLLDKWQADNDAYIMRERATLFTRFITWLLGR